MSPPKGNLDAWLGSSPAGSSSKQNGNGNKSKGKTSKGPSEAAQERRARLAALARETQMALEDIVPDLPSTFQPELAERMFLSSLPPLTPNECPRRSPAKTNIHVVNGDTFNVAIRVGVTSAADGGRVAVLNMASHSNPGGGWLKGSLAQEEALCYRSSLSLSLNKRFYPWKQLMGLYTRDVVIIRDDMASGHKLYDPQTQDYKFVSVLSIAALNRPPLRKIQENTPGGVKEREVYAKESDRTMTKDKMRLCLRMAARRGHRSLVLGALGCGAFHNPPEEVANCWLEVLRENEFKGGWWDGIWFAIYDTRNEGNFDVFERVLSGQEI
ncbi:mitochondrial chaperone BCS1 [Sarocladium implicatum]|nr:mitochondrial chaperone BCS1 [Sarocladium implicatum]